MPKKGTRKKGHWPCEKCGREFVLAAHLGKHKKACTGKPAEAKPPKATTSTRKVLREWKDNKKAQKVVTQEQARMNGHGTLSEAMTAFTTAAADLVTLVKGLEGEVQLYRRENEELRAFKQRASALFESGPKVPRN